MESSQSIVHVTRTKKPPLPSKTSPADMPIMDVIQKLEELSNDDLPDTLKMTMDGQDGQEPIEAHCEAVKKDDGSVQYECRFVHTKPKEPEITNVTPSRVTGKFSLNLPYVFEKKKVIECCLFFF